MAHRPSHRRNLALAPDSPFVDPTLFKKNLPKATTSCPSPQNPDPVLPSRPLFNMSKHLSRLYPNYKTEVAKTPSRNIHLQTKSMALSADFDASKVKINDHKPAETKVVKEARVSKKDGGVEDKKKKKETKSLVEGEEDVLKRMSVSLNGSGGGRRRSFCGSKVGLSDFLASNGAKVVSVDMPPFMQIHAVDCARKTRDSLEKFTSKTLALTLKKEFDGVYGPAWHCIVGTSFGSFVTHSVGGFLYFSLDHKLYILLFKTAVQKAE